MLRTKAKWAGTLVATTALFVAPWEGFKPVASHNRIDPPGIYDYGYGSTNQENPNLKVGDVITEPAARALLANKLATKYLPPLRSCIKNFDKMPWQRQLSVLSASYNLGDYRVCHSSIVVKLNAGDIRGACDAFLLYDRANGKVLRGLELRREDERELCLEGL